MFVASTRVTGVQEMNAAGKALVDDYHDIGLAPETLTFTDTNHFTLYFPLGSG